MCVFIYHTACYAVFVYLYIVNLTNNDNNTVSLLINIVVYTHTCTYTLKIYIDNTRICTIYSHIPASLAPICPVYTQVYRERS